MAIEPPLPALVPDIRRARMADSAAIHALVERAYRGDSAKAGWTHEADLLGGQRTDLAAIAAMVTAEDDAILLAEAPGALLGCVRTARSDPDDKIGRADCAYLGLLAVDPTRQAGGWGARLIAAAEAYAIHHYGARAMAMSVLRQRPELIAYYERRGYRLTGRRAAFPMNDPRFGLPKRADLEFVILVKEFAVEV